MNVPPLTASGEHPASDRRYSLSDIEFEFFRERIAQLAGIHLGEEKRDMVYARLSRRLRATGLTSFASYCELLNSDEPTETQAFVNALTTNLTHFNREPEHFAYLREELLPQLTGRTPPSRPLRFWSAGCSTGEEAYSIAMEIAEAVPDFEQRDIRILATDIDTDVLAHGRVGRYHPKQVHRVDPQRVPKYFRPAGSDALEVVPALRRLVTFNRLNLHDPWPMKGRFDGIFFCNVSIYFESEVQRGFAARFAEVLNDGGCLFLGYTESLVASDDYFEAVQRSLYRPRKATTHRLPIAPERQAPRQQDTN